MRKITSIPVILHLPQTEEAQKQLAQQLAELHAKFVVRKIETLTCPTKQKLELLQAVIDVENKEKQI